MREHLKIQFLLKKYYGQNFRKMIKRTPYSPLNFYGVKTGTKCRQRHCFELLGLFSAVGDRREERSFKYSIA